VTFPIEKFIEIVFLNDFSRMKANLPRKISNFWYTLSSKKRRFFEGRNFCWTCLYVFFFFFFVEIFKNREGANPGTLLVDYI